MSMSTTLAYGVGFLFVLVLILYIGTATSLPYARHERLFTPAERNFYFALRAAVGDRYAIFGKVRVADLVKVTRKTDDKRGFRAFARISQKHVDFVLCHPSTLEIICAVELNDSSHDLKNRVERDQFLTKVFHHIGLPIAWIKARSSYQSKEIAAAVAQAIADTRLAQPSVTEHSHS